MRRFTFTYSMILRQLSYFGSSFLPRGHPTHFTPALSPWWQVQGFPPWPPRLLHPGARHYFPGRTLNPAVNNPGGLSSNRRSLHSSTSLMMDHCDRDQGPPHKRRRSIEEKDGSGDGTQREHHVGLRKESHSLSEGDRGGAGGGVRSQDSRDKHVDKPIMEDKGSVRAGGGQKDPQPVQSQSKPVTHQHVTGTTGWSPPPAVPPPHGVKVKTLHRQWDAFAACSTEPQPPGGSSAFDFSVLSYNILSQELLQDNAHLYRHCKPSVLPWDYRLPNLLSEIQSYDADILCLQEVQEDHFENQIKPALQALGYQCEYKKRTGRKPDGCAVVFKTSRLHLLSANPVEFFQQGDALLDRDNVGLVVLLQPNDTQADPASFICVANTHLLYNPRRGDIKLAQLAILLAEITRLSRLPDGSSSPVLLCGDLNSTPWSPLYNLLTKGYLEYGRLPVTMVSGQEKTSRGHRLLSTPIWSPCLGISQQCQYEATPTAEPPSSSSTAVEGAMTSAPETRAAVSSRSRIEHCLNLQSTYKHHLMPDRRHEITTYHSLTAMTVDYILYTPESVASPPLPAGRGLQLLGRLSLVGQSELKKVNGLPNQQHSSDHLPLLARFRYRC
ncbi:protein angel homolog 2 isoform 2-T2 [Aulostomus maculatus]